MRSLSDEQALRQRVRGQRLAERARTVEDAVRDVVALQAQDARAATLAVWARTDGLTVGDVRRALEEERSVVRLWCLRGTLHLVPAEDVRWLLALFGPVLLPGGRRRRAELGLDDERCERAAAIIRSALVNGPLTRAEIAERLRPHGIPVEGQAIAHAINYAALRGIVCYGPRSGRVETFVLLDDWVPASRTAPGTAADLARRYVAAFGPATPADFAAWSGLPAAIVRAAWAEIAPELQEIEVFGGPAWIARGATEGTTAHHAEPIVRLLPAWDTYLMGYRNRAPILAAEHAKRVQPGAGMIHPTVTVDGCVVGTWRHKLATRRLEVTIVPFAALDDVVVALLEREAADLQRFLGSDLPPDAQLVFNTAGT